MKTLIAIFCLFFVSCEHRDSLPRDFTIGDQLAQAIERFKTDNHHYPAHLSDLVPRYVKEIVAPKCGRGQWEYQRYPDGKYALFLSPKNLGNDAFFYNCDTHRWEIIKNDL